METSAFEQKKKQYIDRIDQIAKESFNNEQKVIAKQILEATNKNNIDSVYQLITQRVKTGFVFDAAPEVNHSCIALVKENLAYSINTDETHTVEHRLIIGENYDALKNLSATYINPKNGKGLIDLIYIDPPYNTDKAKDEGNTYKDYVDSKKFIYRDKFTRDGWLNMMSERLHLAKRLLTDDGITLISIDDSEQAYLKVLCDDIFGEQNFVTTFIWKSKSGGANDSSLIAIDHEYILMYSKNKKKTTINKDLDLEVTTSYNRQDEFGRYSLDRLDKQSLGYQESLDFEIEGPDGKTYTVEHKDPSNKQARWRWSIETVDDRYDELVFNWPYVYTKNYEKMDGHKARSLLVDERFGRTRTGGTLLRDILGVQKVFSYPKSLPLIKYLISITTNKESLILDFFAGSGTTGQAVMELNEEDKGNRRFILVTNNENDIAKKITFERLYRVIKGKGSKNEKVKWAYTKDKPALNNNSMRVFEIEYYEVKLNDFEKAKKLIPMAEEQFKKLNPNYKPKDKFDIYNELAALNPYKKV